jgi:Tol biopolymer transport system component
MRVGVGTAAAVAAAFVATAAGGATPAATARLQSAGTIVFACSGCPGAETGSGLFVVGFSGRGLRQLPPRVSSYRPRWSPDGRSVTFSQNFARIVTLEVPHGRFRVLAAPSRGGANDPAWSPDGRSVAYAQRGRLFVVAGDGTRKRRVGPRRERGFGAPDWSPDGRRIVHHLRGSRLALVNADGTRFRWFLQRVSGRDPRWSPDGRLIAFIRAGGSMPPALMVVRPDGTGLRVLARHPQLDANLAWSPDGRSVLFTAAYVIDREEGLYGHEFLIVSLSGSVRRLEIDGLPRTALSQLNGIDWTRTQVSRMLVG